MITLKVQEPEIVKLSVESSNGISFEMAQGFFIMPESYTGATQVTPTESAQSLATHGKMVNDDIAIDAIPSDYIGSSVARESSSDITQNGATVNVPAGYYAQNATKTIQSGSASTPATQIPVTPSLSVDANGLVSSSVSASQSITPSVSEGYVTNGTPGTVDVSGSNTLHLETQAATTATPSTAEQTIVPAGKFTTGAVKVSAMPAGAKNSQVNTWGWTTTTKKLTITFPNATNGYYTGAAAGAVNPIELTRQTETITPNESTQEVTPTNGTYYITNVTVNPIPNTYAKKYEWVKQLYTANFNLKNDTTYNSWTASTSAGSILATTTLSSTFEADMENYEYLLWWKLWMGFAYTSGATLKAMPIWEGQDAIQSIFRRPNNLTEIQSSTKGANACATQTTAPLLRYYDTSGTVKYTWSNSNGIYATVQASTFSNSTSLTPTVTLKRPVIYAKCSSSYFATGRKAQVDSENCTFYMTCDLYRQPINVYGQTKAYEGIVSTYNAANP